MSDHGYGGRHGVGPRNNGVGKSPISVCLILYARVMTSTRYGITFGGLIFSGGAGVYLGAVPVGAVALISTTFADPASLIGVPVLALLGAAAGSLVAYFTRRSIRPHMQHRYLRGSLAGAITLPISTFIGQLQRVSDNPVTEQWAIGFVLLTGVAGMAVYCQWRKRQTLQRHARRTAQQQEPARR
jgi:hypothetical protein